MLRSVVELKPDLIVFDLTILFPNDLKRSGQVKEMRPSSWLFDKKYQHRKSPTSLCVAEPLGISVI